MNKPNKKMGRPRVSPNSVAMRVTLPQDDIELLRSLCAFTGTRPAAMVRELIQESRPTLTAMLEAMRASRSGESLPAESMAAKMLKHALEGKQPSQSDIFEILSKDKK